MAIFYFDLSAGVDGTGVSWDDPYNSLSHIATLGTGNEAWIKEHDGYTVPAVITLVSNSAKILGGFRSTLIGTEGDTADRPSSTRLVGPGTNLRCLLIAGLTVEVSGLWIDGFEMNDSGPGIHISSGGAVHIYDCAVTRCETNRDSNVNPINGGGINVSAGAVTIENCVVFNNGACDEGGGIYIGAVGCTVRDSVIRGNRCGTVADGSPRFGGGGVYAAVAATIDKCFITGNRSIQPSPGEPKGYAGGVRTAGGTVKNCVISNNTADQQYAAGIDNGSTDYVGCTIINNVAKAPSGYVGGILVNPGTTVSNSILRDNVANTDSYQVYGPTADVGCVNNTSTNLDGVYPTSLKGFAVVDAPVTYEDPPTRYKPIEDSDDFIFDAGNPLRPGYEAVDITGASRKADPSIGAYELGIVEEYAAPVLETTADEILDGLDRDKDVEYWTDERLNALQVIPVSSSRWQLVSTKLDSIPVEMRIYFNDVDDGYFLDLESDDGAINVTGLRLATGMDIVEGLAISEIGGLYVVDLEKQNAEVTFDELGSRFLLMYLPRDYA